MNLHGFVKAFIAAVNPTVPVTVRVSTGSTPGADGRRIPTYATPGQIVASISGTSLIVTAQTVGRLQPGQLLSDESGFILPGTVIIDGPVAGGPGIYQVNNSQTVDAEIMATSLTINGQIQALTFRDITQIEGLNLQGDRRAVYLDGEVDGLVRSLNKGGDLITFPDGSTWLVAMVLEQWPDWVKCAVTLQDGS